MRAWLLVSLCLIWLFSALPVAQAQEERVTLDEYWALVERSLETLSSLEGQAQPDQQPVLDNLAQEWEALREVSLPDGRVVAMQADLLVAQMRAVPVDLGQIRQTLEALQQTQRSTLSSFDEEDVASIQPVLALPEFQWRQEAPSPLDQWLDRLWAWFNELLNKLFGGQGQDVTAENRVPTTNLFSIFASIVFAVLVFLMMRNLLAGLVSESSLDSQGESGEEALTAETALRRAQSLSRGGDYRSAVRFLYLSSLLLLEERGLLRYDRSKTNREVLRSVDDQPGLQQPLKNVVEVFDQVWYGYQPLDQDTYEKYEADVQQIKEQRP